MHSVFLLVWLLIAPAQGQESLLRWNNGDALPGTLLQSKPGQIHWSSSIFADKLVADSKTLESIVFPKQTVEPTEAFRVGTVAGDVWTADLVGSDEDAFLFSSKRYGRVRVNRDAIYSLNRLANPNLAFDGSQHKDWDLALDGPVKDLTYRVYDINEEWERDDPFPDLSKLTPAHEGSLAAGYLDLGLSGFPDVVSAGLHFAMAFEGQIEALEAGEYRFRLYADDQARLFIDGRLVVEFLENGRNPEAGGHTKGVQLGKGFHSLRVEFLELGGEFKLVAGFTGPDDRRQSLVGVNKTSGWRKGPGGHMQSNRKKAGIFGEIKLPKQFEIDLELNASTSPRFVLALGRDALSASLDKSLRLETWGEELVVVQDRIFEPVMTIAEDQRDVRLRLAFASATDELQVYDASGRLLVKVKGVQPTTGASGIFIRNRGEDLIVRRLSVYRRLNAGSGQTLDAARSRVHLIDGQVVYGRLYVTRGGAYVMDQAGTRHNIDLDSIDRIASPGVQLAIRKDVTELGYADGAIVRGQLEQAHADQVILHTAFSETPVTCALAGASRLRFAPSTHAATASNGDIDQLFTASGRLRGRLSFDVAGSPLSWQPSGVAQPLRLANAGAARVERSSESVTKSPFFGTDRFPCRLHLKNGEIIPCQVLSYDKIKLGFESPFIKQGKIDSAHVKAIDFTSPKHEGPKNKSSRKIDAWLTNILGPAPKTSLGIDPIKLERALTVPRFNRDNPPSHVLVAKNGDLKRGSLLGISRQTIEFESKLRKQLVPVTRMARVVNVSKPEAEPNELSEATTDLCAKVRVGLADGSILLFEALESRGGKLLGRSAIYGDVAIPCDSIQDLNMGELEKASRSSLFEAWVLRPAKEPEFGEGQGQ